MYQFTIHTIPEGWLDKVNPLPAPAGCTLFSTIYASPERLICVWQNDGSEFDVGWGETTWALREKNDPVFIDGVGGLG